MRTFARTLISRGPYRDALLDLMRDANTTLDPERIAELLVRRAVQWMPASCWALAATDLGGQQAVLAEQGLTPDLGVAVSAVAAWVMRHEVSLAAADLREETRVLVPATLSVAAWPLSSHGRTIGALVGVDRRRSMRAPRLSARAEAALADLTQPVATALDNALALKRAEALSVTDDLTRLYNSRYLNLVLRRETKRASRSGRPLSLLFVDLDGFKAINDTHGHLYGSRALVEAAAVIRVSARETDVVARFGGDEFALVLPDTGGEGALSVAERVRERIAEHRFLAADGLHIHLTASIGVATLPDVASSAEELVQAADKAMYRVKDSGKNGVQVAFDPLG